MKLSPEEKKQYNRHLILDEIGELGQKKLKSAKVLVIGAGGLGCPILQYIVGAGVGTIGIIDDDKINQSNLQRQVLYTQNDIGQFKVKVANQRLVALNPFINFQTYTQKLTPKNAIELFNSYDIIVDGSDNFPTRYLVNDAALLTNKALVFGSIFKFEGQVSVFNYKNGPTYRCLYPNPPSPSEMPNCSQIGVLGILPGIIGTLQANEILKMICGIGNVLSGKLLTYNALSMQQSILSFEKNETIKIEALNKDYDFFCGLPKHNKEITKEELKKQSKKYNLLDVRTNRERKQFNIGGQHIPLDQLKNRIKEIPQNKDLVVYCKSGARSIMAIEILQDKNLKPSLIHLKGGIFD